MTRALTAALLLVAVAPLRAQPLGPAPADPAFVAWEEGDYPAALDGFERLLASAEAARYLEPIALVTGELYHTTTVAPDGARLRWSADGTVASYTTDAGRMAHVVAVDGDGARPLASVAGVGLVLAPTGRHAAYFVVDETPALRAARAAADSLRRLVDSQETYDAFLQQQRAATRMEQEAARVVLRDLGSGEERELPTPALARQALAFSADGRALYLAAAPLGETERTDLYVLAPGEPARALTDGPGPKQNPVAVPGGRHLVYTTGPATFAVRDLATGQTRAVEGEAPAVSADGSTLAFLTRADAEFAVRALALDEDATEPVVVRRSDRPIAAPVPSPDGRRVAFAMQPEHDWEVYVVGRDGAGEVRVTREIQHDRSPRWLGPDRLLAMKGEPRHTRAHVYDLATGASHRLHHNNTVRTVAPEYEWAASPDGARVLLVADRDGDTISPERGVYLVDLGRRVTADDVRARVRASAAAERDLRERGRQTFAPIEAAVRAATDDVSVARIYAYEEALFQFDSKYITQPGNALAIDYLAAQLRAFGYEPELQTFEPLPGVRTANVVATLRGTTDPDLVYVVSSHFDSVEEGPGADDNTSGTAALLEVARVLAARPQAATIRFAWFTGEEAGLLGSREFVRRAVADGTRIVGALNNDMVGWANDHRLDNTIRYSNSGIRDVQHAAAFLFSDLITYDARYYRGTDAHAYYEVYGDIVGGIGSYPILGSPHYHQPHDVLATVSHRLVAEVARTTAASVLLLASSPARLTGLTLADGPGGTEVTWTPAAETGVRQYLVAHGPPDDPLQQTLTVDRPRATLPALAPGTVVSVKAVDGRGLQSWDWARVVAGSD